MPANFKTYEAQARLLAAVIAAHPELRLNYKAIAQHYGKSATMSAIEHRFRPIRKQADCLRLAVTKGIDPEVIDILEPGEIAKTFGESTADGLQFQFRGIKAAAEAMKNAADNGQDPIEAFNNASSGSGANKTPSGRKRGRPAGTTPATGRSTATAKPRRSTAKKPSYVESATTTDKDESAGPVDYDALDDDSPTGHLTKKQRTTPIKAALPPRRISGTAGEPPISQPVFKTEALDEIFEVGDRLPSPSPMPPTASVSMSTPGNVSNGANNNNDFFKANTNMPRNERAESEYHTPVPEFPTATTSAHTQSQNQSQSQSQGYNMNAGISFDGGLSTSFAASSTSGMIFDNHNNGYTITSNNGFHPSYNSQQNNAQQSSAGNGAGYINIVSDDEDDHYSQSVVGGAAIRHLGGGPTAGNHFGQTTTTSSMAMGMSMMNNGTNSDMGGFYVEEDQYEI